MSLKHPHIEPLRFLIRHLLNLVMWIGITGIQPLLVRAESFATLLTDIRGIVPVFHLGV